MGTENSQANKPALVIMAAGMGSRFGGLKQITSVGPSGEMIIDYSIYDALKAGFETIVFVIKHEIEDSFKERIGDRISRQAEVKYVYQEMDTLPEGFAVPTGRVKPWGTGHAVLCCRDTLQGRPFAVINADDYYGPRCFGLLYDFLAAKQAGSGLHIAMAGYILENTLTENGYVSRGVCSVDGSGYLTDLVERTHIELRGGRAMFTEDAGNSWTALPEGCRVSMNCWAFPVGTLDYFGSLFRNFLVSASNLQKSEFYLPFAVNSLIEAGLTDVRVLETGDRWYGMTYKEDQQKVVDAIRTMVNEGTYPERLWTK